MATTGAVREQARPKETQNEIPALLHEPICTRCGGLLVRDFCTDLLNGTGELNCSIARCVQCGDVVDPVIQRNRHLQQTAGTVLDMKASGSSIHGQFSV